MLEKKDFLFTTETTPDVSTDLSASSKKIDAINLIPLLGFDIQSGKCKFCNSNISKFYPFTEIFFLKTRMDLYIHQYLTRF